MKGQPDVIAALNRLLASELSAMDQYFTHSEMYRNWGLEKLYERIHHEFDDEKGHATALIERILFLEGKPDLVTRDPIHIGADVHAALDIARPSFTGCLGVEGAGDGFVTLTPDFYLPRITALDESSHGAPRTSVARNCPAGVPNAQRPRFWRGR